MFAFAQRIRCTRRRSTLPDANHFRLRAEQLEDRMTPSGIVSGAFGWAVGFGSTEDDVGQKTATDPNGNVIVTGNFQGTVDFDPGPGDFNLTSAGSNDIFIAKYSATGSLLWARALGGTGDDQPRGIAVDGSGSIYMGGFFSATADFDPGVGSANLTSVGYDAFVSKLDANGNYVWARRLGGDGNNDARAIAVDTSGNVYTTGYFNGTADFDAGPGIANLTSAGPTAAYVSKLSTDGNHVWARGIGGTDGAGGNGIAVDVSGNVYIAGDFGGTADFDPGAGTVNLTAAGYSDVFVSKMDANGNLAWARGMGGVLVDQVWGTAIDESGSVYTTGQFGGSADFDPGPGTVSLTSAGGYDAFTSKLDTNGNYDWARNAGGTGDDGGRAIAVGVSGSIYTTGLFSDIADFDPGPGIAFLSSAGGFDASISKLDSGGNHVWSRRIGGGGTDVGHGIAIDAGGNVYTTGLFSTTGDFDPGAGVATITSAGGLDVFVSKLLDLAAVTRTVDAHQGPWAFAPGVLNDHYRYGFNDHLAPLVIGPVDGFDFTAGGTFTVAYLSGTTSALPALFGFSDARGHTGWPQYGSDTPGTSLAYFPSRYMNPAEYPIYMNALVGTFADDAGQIVGVPFPVNLGRAVVVPEGATRLQLGINDDVFYDNAGSLTVRISGPRAAPVISSNGGGGAAAISVPENTTAVTTVTATSTDPNAVLTYSISGGADATDFAINATTGVLTFATAPNFENPADAGANNVYDVTVQVSDGTLTDTQAIAVTVTDVNEAPTASLDGPSHGVRGQPRSYTGSLTDPNTADGHTLTWEARDQGNVLVASGSGATFDFTPVETGSYSVTFTVSDGLGSTASADATLVVGIVELQNDPRKAGKTMLVAGGTNSNDRIVFKRGQATGQILVVVNTVTYGPFISTGRIVPYGLAGDDHLRAKNLDLSSWLYGGQGNDTLYGGARADVLLGGAGSDFLFGRNRRDILVGGAGEDEVSGGRGEDIMIGGTTAFDANELALCLIQAEWTSPLGFARRVDNLQGVPNPKFAQRANADYFLQSGATVSDDGARDRLAGNDGRSWFFGNVAGEGVFDGILDFGGNDVLDDV